MSRTVYITLVAAGIALFLSVACERKPNPETVQGPSAGALAVLHQEGIRIIRLHCLNCHGLDGKSEAQMLAPPLWGVRQHYLRAFPDEASFVAAMTDVLGEPSVEKCQMPKAVQRYGLMPPMLLDEASLEGASRAIYAGQVKRPTWWKAYESAHEDCGPEVDE